MTKEITKDIAAKVLETVDAGLVRGVGEPVPGQMCVEAAVCYAMGLPHGDEPSCVSPALRSLKIKLNDSGWSSPAARAHGLRRLALAQLGSAGALNEQDFLARVAEMTVRVIVPRALRSAASIHPQKEHQAALAAAAKRCETDGDRAAARAARAAAAAAADAYAARAAAAAAAYAARAARAARAAAAAAADATAYATDAAAYAAAYATAYATDAADAYAARDEALAFFAEEVVQILIAMKAPGCQWLYLTEATI